VTPGEVRPDADLDRDAALVMAVMDVLSSQWLLNRTSTSPAP
jgi:hypothetical protein